MTHCYNCLVKSLTNLHMVLTSVLTMTAGVLEFARFLLLLDLIHSKIGTLTVSTFPSEVITSSPESTRLSESDERQYGTNSNN